VAASLVPKRFAADYDVTVDVAEVDLQVVDAAKRYFELEESENLNVHTTGGRQFLRRPTTSTTSSSSTPTGRTRSPSS